MTGQKIPLMMNKLAFRARHSVQVMADMAARSSFLPLLPPRSMVGQLPLEQHIGVRIPGGQPTVLLPPTLRSLFLARHGFVTGLAAQDSSASLFDREHGIHGNLKLHTAGVDGQLLVADLNCACHHASHPHSTSEAVYRFVEDRRSLIF